MDEMVERIARMLYWESWAKDAPGRIWEEAHPSVRQGWREAARKIIKAMTEPTEKMRNAAVNATALSDSAVYVTWRAMISAALGSRIVWIGNDDRTDGSPE
jgi:hypothetical protein